MNENNNTTMTTAPAENMKIDDKVTKKMIASALVEVDGYLGTSTGLVGGITGMLKKNTTEEEDALSGISVSMSDNAVDVTVKVIVEAGKNIPTIANAITAKVEQKLHDIGGFATKQVRVEVVDTMTKAEYDEKHGKKDKEKEAAE